MVMSQTQVYFKQQKSSQQVFPNPNSAVLVITWAMAAVYVSVGVNQPLYSAFLLQWHIDNPLPYSELGHNNKTPPSVSLNVIEA